MGLRVNEKLNGFARNIIGSINNQLITLQLDLTDFCVCKCAGCEHWKWPVKKSLDFDILEKNVFNHLHKFKSLQSIVLSGGEPLLHTKVELIVRHLKNMGYNIGIITSGLGHNNLNLKSLSNDCSWIRLSSDGFTNEQYEKTRGVPLFDKWTSNLNKLMEYNQKSNCETRLNITIHEYNINELAPLPMKLFNFLSNNKETLYNIEVYFWLSREIINDLRQYKNDSKFYSVLQNLSFESLKTGARVFNTFCRFNIENVKRHLTIGESIHYKSCYVPQIFGLVASDGNVFPCCYMYEPVFEYNKQEIKYVIGNINDNNLFEIYSSDRYFEIVNEFQNCNKKYDQCKYCDRFDHINDYLNKFESKQEIFL